MRSAEAPRVALVSHDWSSRTGAGRCAQELSAALREDPSLVVPLADDALPQRLTGRRRLLAKVGRALRTARILRAARIDVVVVNTTIQASMVVAARLAGARVVWWCHESAGSFAGPLMRLRLWVYRRLSHEQVGVSTAVPSPAGPGRTIQNIVRVVPDAPHLDRRLLVLGTKSRGKGADRLPALTEGQVDDPTLTLEVVGWDDPRDAELLVVVERRLRDLWGDRLVWSGATDRPEDAYARAAVLLLPSRAETRPRVVEEALGRGIPVVASDLPGLVDIAADVLEPRALALAEDPASWDRAIRAALALGTSDTPYLRGFSPEQFHAAWSVAIRQVHARD